MLFQLIGVGLLGNVGRSVYLWHIKFSGMNDGVMDDNFDPEESRRQELQELEHELQTLKWDRDDINRQIEQLEERILKLGNSL